MNSFRKKWRARKYQQISGRKTKYMLSRHADGKKDIRLPRFIWAWWV